MKESVLICENWDGRSDKQWLFWLRKKLETIGFDVQMLELPRIKASMNDWLPELQETYGIKGENIHVVKTDPGCITIFQYLKSLGRNSNPSPTMLVAGKTKRRSSPEGNIIKPKAVSYRLLPNSMQVVKVVKDIIVKNDDDKLADLDVSLVVLYSGRVSENVTIPNPKLQFS